MNESSEPVPVAEYTCPMHPEVVQTVPGRCPKCNMQLEPKKTASAKADSCCD